MHPLISQQHASDAFKLTAYSTHHSVSILTCGGSDGKPRVVKRFAAPTPDGRFLTPPRPLLPLLAPRSLCQSSLGGIPLRANPSRASGEDGVGTRTGRGMGYLSSLPCLLLLVSCYRFVTFAVIVSLSIHRFHPLSLIHDCRSPPLPFSPLCESVSH